jgi:hypothetical protein
MRGEIAREPARSEKIGEDLAVVVTEGPAGGAVEPGHLGQHAHVAAPSPGQAGGQAGQAALARVLQAAPGAADRHAHLGGLGGHPQFGEQPGEQLIGALVVNDEAGVDAGRVGVGLASVRTSSPRSGP